MKKLVRFSCVMLGAASALMLHANKQSTNYQDCTSRSYFDVRPYFQNGPEQNSFFRNDLMDSSEDNCGGAFQIVPFGGASGSSNKLASYFLPPTAKGCILTVQEYNPNLNNDTPADTWQLFTNNEGVRPGVNLEARNFNIRTKNGTFKSEISFRPKQTYFGVGFQWKQRLTTKDNGKTELWFEAKAPFVHVSNKMNLDELVLDKGGGVDLSHNNGKGLDNAPVVANMKEAFAQMNWKYGRINDCNEPSTKNGFADLELRLGYNPVQEGCCLLSTHVGIVFPTGNKPKALKMFEPIVGNGHHFGVLWGTAILVDLWSCEKNALSTAFDIRARYLCQNKQMRMFDLHHKPWSRFLEVYQNIDAAAAAYNNPDTFGSYSGTSGINVFTLCAKVTPRFQTDFNTGLIYKHYNGRCGVFMAEAGINTWVRQGDKIELNCCDSLGGVAIKDIQGLGNTQYARTINNNFYSEQYPYGGLLANSDVYGSAPANNVGIRYAALTADDIDLHSGGAPYALSFTGYLTLGYKRSEDCPEFMSVGGSYEAANCNAVLHRWMVWGKLGTTF